MKPAIIFSLLSIPTCLLPVTARCAETAIMAPVAGKCPVLWRGVLSGNDYGAASFSLTDARTGRSAWLSVGEKGSFAKVAAYDMTRRILTLEVSGRRYEIRMEGARIETEADASFETEWAKPGSVKIEGLESLSKLNRARRSLVLKKIAATIARFDSEVKSAREKLAATVAKDPAYEIGATEDPSNWEKNISLATIAGPGGSVSVTVDDFEYTGGAHGGTTLTDLNFVGAEDTPSPASELIGTDKDSLVRLSALAENALAAKGYVVSPNFHGGLEPTAENFSNIGLTPTGLRVRFGDYQVGPYGDGRRQVEIPASALKGVGTEKLLRLWPAISRK